VRRRGKTKQRARQPAYREKWDRKRSKEGERTSEVKKKELIYHPKENPRMLTRLIRFTPSRAKSKNREVRQKGQRRESKTRTGNSPYL